MPRYHFIHYARYDTRFFYRERVSYLMMDVPQITNQNSKFTVRWDNAPHHKAIDSFPQHKHCRNGETVASFINDIFDVFNSLDNELKNEI